MAVDEKAQRQLRNRLQETIGPDETDTLMESLGTLGEEIRGARHDVQLLGVKVERDMAHLRGELKTDMAQLRTEFTGLRTEFAELRGELKTDIAELRTDVAERLEQQTRQMLFGMIGAMATISGIAFGAARLG